MCKFSYYLLPHILHPTRVTDRSATVIDNIFSKALFMKQLVAIQSHKCLIISTFLILNKVAIDYKTCSFAKPDFSNFSEQRSTDGFATQNMDILIKQRYFQILNLICFMILYHLTWIIMFQLKNEQKRFNLHSTPWANPKI